MRSQASEGEHHKGDAASRKQGHRATAASPILPGNRAELEVLRLECRSLVNKRAGLSAGAAVIPIPGADIGADAALLLDMIPAINRKFGLSPDQIEHLDPHLKRVVLVGITSVGSELVGRLVTKPLVLQVLKRIGLRVGTKSAARFVPLLGQALAASISFAAMRAVGNAHVQDCYAVALRALEQGEHPTA